MQQYCPLLIHFLEGMLSALAAVQCCAQEVAQGWQVLPRELWAAISVSSCLVAILVPPDSSSSL